MTLSSSGFARLSFARLSFVQKIALQLPGGGDEAAPVLRDRSRSRFAAYPRGPFADHRVPVYGP
jgi:hypothetical protein